MLPTARTGQPQLQIHLGDAAVQFKPSALLQRVPGVAYKTLMELMSPPRVSPWCLAMSQVFPEILQHNGPIKHASHLLHIRVGWLSSLNTNVAANPCRANLVLLL